MINLKTYQEPKLDVFEAKYEQGLAASNSLDESSSIGNYSIWNDWED